MRGKLEEVYCAQAHQIIRKKRKDPVDSTVRYEMMNHKLTRVGN